MTECSFFGWTIPSLYPKFINHNTLFNPSSTSISLWNRESWVSACKILEQGNIFLKSIAFVLHRWKKVLFFKKFGKNFHFWWSIFSFLWPHTFLLRVCAVVAVYWMWGHMRRQLRLKQASRTAGKHTGLSHLRRQHALSLLDYLSLSLVPRFFHAHT